MLHLACFGGASSVFSVLKKFNADLGVFYGERYRRDVCIKALNGDRVVPPCNYFFVSFKKVEMKNLPPFC